MTPIQLKIEESRQFVQNLEIDPPKLFRAPETSDIDQEGSVPNYKNRADQAVVIGSQIAEFAADVPPELRPQISNSLLLAQLAANKAKAKSRGGSQEWFGKYIDALTSMGWVGEEIADAEHKVSGDAIQVHNEIVKVVEMALGPAATTSFVLAALKGLKDMSKNRPWITLFDRQSQTRTVQQFQIAYARANGGSAPAIILVCFELSASASVTQILISKSTECEAKLTHRQIKLSMNETIFDAVKDVVRDRIAAHTTKLVRAINF